MRKKVTRWVSRDFNGHYALWIKKPKYDLKTKMYYEAKKSSYIPGSVQLDDLFELNVACGGIAKITIERCY